MTETAATKTPAADPAGTALTKRASIKLMVLDLHKRNEDRPNELKSEDDFVLDIMANVLNAETAEDIFAAADTGSISGQDFAERPFNLRAEDLEFVLSAQQYRDAGAFPYFARFACTSLENDEIMHVSCGGKSLVAILYALQTKGFLDDEGMDLVIREIATQSGYSALTLRPFAAPKVRKAKAKSDS